MLSAVAFGALVFVLGSAVPAAAADKFGGAFKGSSSDSSSVVWFAVVIAVAVAVASLLAHLTTRMQKRKVTAARKKENQKIAQNFKEQAAGQGFEFSESRTLENIALRFEAKNPGSLLETPEGRERLLADVQRRKRRRQREIKLLDNIEKKLQRVSEGAIHQREFMRAEVNMPLWIAPENDVFLPPTAAEEDTDDPLAQSGSVRGQRRRCRAQSGQVCAAPSFCEYAL